MASPGRFLVAVSVAASLGLAGPGLADLDKCQKTIQKNASKNQAKVLKALTKCADAYRIEVEKAAARGSSPDLARAGAKCQIQLDKAINLANATSSFSKTRAALAAASECTDQDLSTLGHLPPNLTGSRWQDWVLMSNLKGAMEQYLAVVQDGLNIMDDLFDAGGCPLCQDLVRSPCNKHACILAPGSETNVNGLPIPLSGAQLIDVCRYPPLFADQFLLIGSPSQGTEVVDLGAVQVCVRGIRSAGVIECGAGNPRVDYHTCQDHVVGGADAESTDECESLLTAPFCGDDSTEGAGDPHPGTVNGGACIELTASAASPGDAFLQNTNQLVVVASGEEGPDMIPCTADDTAAQTPPTALPQTTGTVQATLFDSGASLGTTLTAGPITGSPFTCNVVEAGDMGGGELVSAFPAVDALLGADVRATVRLICQ